MKAIFLKSLFVSLIVGLVAYEYLHLPDVSLLKKNNPRATALM